MMATRKPASKPASKDASKRARTKRKAVRSAEQEATAAAAARMAALLAAIADTEEHLQAYADRLRETVDQVQRGEINYAHGWNRVRKIANEIASAK